jgi:hypothetical protein
MTPVDKSTLARWHGLDATGVLCALAEHAKQDCTYVPAASRASSRWHASVHGRDYELLLTGPKFWDTRAKRGGGGAVDLTMHLCGLDFRHAAIRLAELGL